MGRLDFKTSSKSSCESMVLSSMSVTCGIDTYDLCNSYRVGMVFDSYTQGVAHFIRLPWARTVAPLQGAEKRGSFVTKP